MDYIGTTLGLNVTYMPWESVNTMPYFILDRYEIQKITIGPVDALMPHRTGLLYRYSAYDIQSGVSRF